MHSRGRFYQTASAPFRSDLVSSKTSLYAVMVNDISIRVSKIFEAQSMLKTPRARLYNNENGKVVIEAPILPTALQQLRIWACWSDLCPR